MTNTDSDTTNASSKFDSSEGLRRFEKAPIPEKGVLLSWLRQMLLIREFEVRTMQAYQNRLIGGFCHIYIGQEAIAVASIAAMNADPEVLQSMLDSFKSRRDLVLKELSKMDGVKINVPDGAFYVFPDISSFFGKSAGNVTINNASDLCIYLLSEALVALVTGDAFGDPNCIRISYAASEDMLKEALNRVAQALLKLK